jgi:hypothetical protein
MPDDRVAKYLEDAYRRLDRRKLVSKKLKKSKEGSASVQPEWGPTNEQVKKIMKELTCNLIWSDSEDDKVIEISSSSSTPTV